MHSTPWCSTSCNDSIRKLRLPGLFSAAVARGRHGQFEPETAALVGLGIDTRFAAHPLGAFADQGQANAGAGIGLRRMQPLEQPKDFLLVIALDPNAVVLNDDAHALLEGLAG